MFHYAAIEPDRILPHLTKLFEQRRLEILIGSRRFIGRKHNAYLHASDIQSVPAARNDFRQLASTVYRSRDKFPTITFCPKDRLDERRPLYREARRSLYQRSPLRLCWAFHQNQPPTKRYLGREGSLLRLSSEEIQSCICNSVVWRQ